jgi:apolipoprotein N-acyltransferase
MVAAATWTTRPRVDELPSSTCILSCQGYLRHANIHQNQVQTRNVLLIISAGAASALLVYFGTGLHPNWWLLWFAPVPVIAIASRLGWRASFLLAVVAWFVGALNQWDYFKHEVELPLWLIVVAFLVPAIIFGLGVLRTRTFLRRGWLFAAALYFPAYWVTYEYFTEIASPHSTFGNLGYTQMNCLPLIQIASITGIWGISFTVFLFAATIAALISNAGTPRQRRALAITVGVVLCAIFLFGEWRLNSNPPGQPIAVTLIAKDVPISLYRGSEAQAMALLHDYADEISRVTPPGTDVVVLPEKIVRIGESALPQVDALFSTAAADVHSAIVVGLVRRTADSAFNSSRFYSADGKLEANYDKQHLIPGVEREKPGNKRVLLERPNGRWGLQICKDMDFPTLSRDYAGGGANLLLVPAWDFNVDRWLHARMAVLRAVENSFGLARSARNGLLTLADNRGRIIAERSTIPDRFVSVSGKLNLLRARTFYSRTGDWFAWLCVVVFIGLFASLFVRRSYAARDGAS